ncbi:hypothetical protein LGL55_02730 [Clostridium tagluense]|uniref:hypothetical protein n=1 Tax=Clostridium tagluense TaxID=360422 RepID=UPI001CF31285|nr:hypothetical protein [Clostridium tagluense]MCB2310034.1 hypothetical protein [Clostridium tagluense]MCB2314436.1 hypothetical protein [Clostridium tagluense]MCB2319282.1 hypothetical protein [Clostridium tagluense]MCB2324628.1 hypothetical protein [Clostridium tagluense]MCB2329479.1 hypothetical protein [Clostridium tagluense]
MDIINEIKTNVKEYNINAFYKNLELLTNLLNDILESLSGNYANTFREIIKLIFISLENKDYHLFIDILQFEVEPYLEKAGCNE